MNQAPDIKSKRDFHYIFGPVHSNRFGRSLGIDLVPVKVCSFDCLFCQVGRTTSKTSVRKEYVPIKDVIEEFEVWLKSGDTADYVTLSGSGEPTLHSRFGEVLDAVNERCLIKKALLSNSSLFYLPEVRSAALKADLVKASLSAWDQVSFDAINRPYLDLKFKKIIDGLCNFRSEFKGEMLIEVFVLSGFNSSIDNMKKIAKFVNAINPDRVHLNTVIRPPAEITAKPVPFDVLQTFTNIFSSHTEVVSINTQICSSDKSFVGIRPLRSSV